METALTILRWVLGAPLVAVGAYIIVGGWVLTVTWLWSRLRSRNQNLQSFIPLVGPLSLILGLALWPIEHAWRLGWLPVVIDPATITLLRVVGPVLRALFLPDSEELEVIAGAKTYEVDFTTPEGAILCIEDAYRRHDLEAAVACKDFTIAARLMLEKIDIGTDPPQEVVTKTAEVLELAFRKEIAHEWPDCAGIESFFIERKPYKNGVVVVTEVCRFKDGSTTREELLVAETQNGWRVLNSL